MSFFNDPFAPPTHSSSPVPSQMWRNFFERRTQESAFDLGPYEKWWRDHSTTLVSRGYQLRHRFRPGWRPSWIGKGLIPYTCEDSLESFNHPVMDAKRVDNGSTVAIKRVVNGSMEIQIATMLSGPSLRQDPANHCVPIYDSFKDNNEQHITYLVMPLLRNFNSPPFHYVGDAVDFMRQTLTGLYFMHKLGVAHRNLSDNNIMMDARNMYPEGFHPSWQSHSAQEIIKPAPYIHRGDAGSVRYYFVDFANALYFGDKNGQRLVTGNATHIEDKTVPEFRSNGSAYDPFPVDVYTLGRVYKRNFLDKFVNVDFLGSFIESMIKEAPAQRPTASQALRQFELLFSQLGSNVLRSKLKSRK